MRKCCFIYFISYCRDAAANSVSSLSLTFNSDSKLSFLILLKDRNDQHNTKITNIQTYFLKYKEIQLLVDQHLVKPLINKMK